MAVEHMLVSVLHCPLFSKEFLQIAAPYRAYCYSVKFRILSVGFSSRMQLMRLDIFGYICIG
jgi:hypothetical protein